MHRIFRNDLEALFISRPNRFLIHAGCPDNPIRAHCPNPGRMTELLLPGSTLILEERQKPHSGKTSYSAQAVRYGGKIIPLDTMRTNRIAGEVLLPQLFPDALDIRAEIRAAGSRFDFLVTRRQGATLVEVKTCSLCEEGIAMFPDAPTERGLRHVRELANLHSDAGAAEEAGLPYPLGGLILVVVVHGDARCFVPNVHTDPDFASALADAVMPMETQAGTRQVQVPASGGSTGPSLRVVSVAADSEGRVQVVNPALPVHLAPVNLVRENRGCYMLIIQNTERRRIEVGALGERIFMPGWYVYVGSAMGMLRARISRHLRKRKKMHWHVDYLIAEADGVTALPIYTDRDLECRLAKQVAAIGLDLVQGFGCSDCSCKSHLVHFAEAPFSRRDFVDLLLRYRHREAFSCRIGYSRL